MSEIFVWESARGWKIVEAWRDKHGCPYSQFIVLVDGLRWRTAVELAKRLRRTFSLK